MVSRQDKTRALMFVYDRLVASGMYEVQAPERDLTHLVLTDDPSHHLGAPELRHYVVACAPFFDTVAQFQDFCEEQTQQGRFVAPLLYKGTNRDPHKSSGFVRMVEVSTAHRRDKSFKHYSSKQVNDILYLRDNELAVCDLIGNDVVYFQASRDSSGEDVLQGYELTPVNLDYSHLRHLRNINSRKRPPRQLPNDGPSRVYRLPQLLFDVGAQDALQLVIHNPRVHRAMLTHSLTTEQREAVINLDLETTARGAFRAHVDDDGEVGEALDYLYPDEDLQYST